MSDRKCCVEGCPNTLKPGKGARGMCQRCYAAYRLDYIERGEPMPPPEPRPRRVPVGGKAPKKNVDACTACGGPRGPKPNRGMCNACYLRWYKHHKKNGIPLPPIGRERTMVLGKNPVPCAVDGCDNLVDVKGARGMCSGCYSAWNRARRQAKEDFDLNNLAIKKCTDCGEVKPIEDFYASPATGAPTRRCVPCHCEYMRKWRRRKEGHAEDYVPPPPRKQPAPTGTVRRGPNGYSQIKLPEHHRANKRGWASHHIVVAEEKYGIQITNEFTVHHKNGDIGDNRPENLELRVGQHGKHADAVDGLLVVPELRERAVVVLRGFGYRVTPPEVTKVGRRTRKGQPLPGQHCLLDAVKEIA